MVSIQYIVLRVVLALRLRRLLVAVGVAEQGNGAKGNKCVRDLSNRFCFKRERIF